MIDGLLAAVNDLPVWAFLLSIGLLMTIETTMLVGLLLPSDLIVLFAASGTTSPARLGLLLVAVVQGSLAGETLGYALGRSLGDRVRGGRFGRWVGARRWDSAAALLDRRGGQALLAARFLPGVHAIVPVLAGTVRLRYRRFVRRCAVAALAWAALYVGLGVTAGASYRRVAERLGTISAVVVAAVGAALLATAAVALVRRLRQRSLPLAP